jgi:hypothetical protein
VDVFTTSLSQWRLARAHDILMVDTTVKGNQSIFRPSWDIVLGHKAGRIDDEEYTQEYKRLMNESWKAHKAQWLEFIAQTEPVALACFCTARSAPYVNPDGTFFCHRFVLKDILERLCRAKGIEYRYYGELS